MAMFSILIVMIPQTYTYIKTYQIAGLKCVWFIVYQLYLNKAFKIYKVKNNDWWRGQSEKLKASVCLSLFTFYLGFPLPLQIDMPLGSIDILIVISLI
jgi:hypothetical protein